MNAKLILLFVIITVLLWSCTSNGQSKKVVKASPAAEEEDRMPTRRELFGAFRQMGELHLVYGTQKPAVEEAYKELSENFPNTFRNIKIKVLKDTEVTEEDLTTKVLYFLGSSSSNKWMPSLLEKLPIQKIDNGFEFAKKTFQSEEHIFKMTFYPNPFNQKLPLLLAFANSDQALINSLEKQAKPSANEFFGNSWGYEIYENEKRIILGSFSQKDWIFNPSTHWDFSEGEKSIVESDHFKFIAHDANINSEAIERMATACEATLKEITTFTKVEKKLPLIDYHLYSSVEKKGLMKGNTDQAHIDINSNEVHALFNEAYTDNFIQKENELIIHFLLGDATTKAIQKGLAIHFTKKWQKKGYRYWAARLAHSDNSLSLNELLDNEKMTKESYLVTDCLSATFVDFLLEEWGKEKLLAEYSTWTPTKSEINKLKPKWKDFLKALPKAEFVSKLPTGQAGKEITPYLKGFNFAHEGYQIYNGYTSNLAIESLQQMSNIGSNAMAIVPYTFMRNPEKPSPLIIEHGAGGENDEGVIHSTFEAKKMGMTTVMKPQVWLGRGWPGDVNMNNEKDWKSFFDYYYRWMRHYAFLCEIHEIDMLSLGVEFAKATLKREKDWRALIKKIRGMYSGPITYSANWGDEFEKLNFWDELDFIGLNCYYPLSKNKKASKREMKKEWKRTVRKIETVYNKYKKPIIFTEIGFRSVNHPWVNPHEDAQGRHFNEEDQAICYDIVFEGIQNKKWCAGILWWKWPSYLNYRGLRNTGFSPNNKITEDRIADWFSRL